MEQTEQHGLFESKLNESGKIYIRKFATAVRLLILIGALVSLLSLTISMIRFIKMNSFDAFGDKLVQFQYHVYPFYLLVYVVLAILQLYALWKLSIYLSKGADYNDEVSFNESFRYLYRNTIFAVISLGISLLMGLLDLYIFLKYYML